MILPIVACAFLSNPQFSTWETVPLTFKTDSSHKILSTHWVDKSKQSWSFDWTFNESGGVIDIWLHGPKIELPTNSHYGPYFRYKADGYGFLDSDSMSRIELSDWELNILRLGTPAVGISVSNFICIIRHKATNQVFIEQGTADGDDFVLSKSSSHPLLQFYGRDRTNGFTNTTTTSYKLVNGVISRETITKSHRP